MRIKMLLYYTHKYTHTHIYIYLCVCICITNTLLVHNVFIRAGSVNGSF